MLNQFTVLKYYKRVALYSILVCKLLSYLCKISWTLWKGNHVQTSDEWRNQVNNLFTDIPPVHYDEWWNIWHKQQYLETVTSNIKSLRHRCVLSPCPHLLIKGMSPVCCHCGGWVLQWWWWLLGFELSSVIVDSLSFKRGSEVESDNRESSRIACWLL